MSSYRKTMGEAYNGMYLVEGNIDKIKDIVSKKKASKIDGVMVDMFTASAISQIYDKVNDANKKKMEKLPITKLAALAMKMMKNEYVPEEVELDEGSMNDVIVMRKGRVSVSVIANASNVKKKEKEGFKIDGVIEKGSKILHKEPKRIMKAIKGGDKLGIGEKLDKDDEKVVKKVVDKLKKASQAHAGQSKDLQKAIDEDGHTDVASAQNNVKVATAALTKMSGELAKLSPEDALPSWWTNKVAVAVDKLDGMADYLDTQVEEVDEDYVLTVKDKEVNRYKSEKDARKAFHDLVKQHGHRNVKVFKEEVELDESVIEQLKSLAKGGSRYKPKSGAVEIKDDKGKVINKLTPEGAKKVLDKMKDPISGKSSVPDRTRGGAEKKIIDIVKNFKEEADLDEASARGDAKRSMSRDRDFGRKDDLDKDDAASDDDVKAASKNIMMQLRKAANRASRGVEFGDKKKVMVDPKIAQAVASKYNSLRRPADKEKFQAQIAKSYKDMLKAIKEAVSPAQQAAIAISKKERGEKPKKESKLSTINKQLKGEK